MVYYLSMGAWKNNIPKRKIISVLLSTAIITGSVGMYPIKAKAVSEAVQLQLNSLSVSLKHILDDKYQIIEKEIKEQVVEKGWDYSLTCESMNEYDFKDAEYINMLAAYMTAKEYCRNNGQSFKYFEELPLINYEIEEKTATLKIPLKVPNYIESEDGYYVKSGNIYITEDRTIPTYKEDKPDRYVKTGSEDVVLDTKEVSYADVKFKVLTAEEILDEYELPTKEFDTYKKRIDVLTKTADNTSIYQSIFARLPAGYTYIGNTELLNESYQRKLVLSTAATLIGMIPYEWGGKPTKAGYDSSWWTFDENNNQKGLDCSGFVQWVFLTAGYDLNLCSKFTTVANTIDSGLPEISYEELRPGDLGTYEGPITNHIGIYAGNDKWIHCTGGNQRTVVIDDFGFTRFFRAIEGDDYRDDIDIASIVNEKVFAETTPMTYSEEDVMLLASLMQHEAGSEGLNGWIGVGEVVRNRLNSELFPNTIEEVIFQPGQFTTASELYGSTPTDEIIKTASLVLEGKLNVLNNSNIMYFRNPMITDGIPATERVDWGKYRYNTSIGHHAFYEQT